jgi:hypothetical protein
MSEHDDCNRFGPVNCLVKKYMGLCVDFCSRHVSSGSCVFPLIVFRRNLFFAPSRFHNKLETHAFVLDITPQDGANNYDSEIDTVFGVVVGVVVGGKLAPLLVYGV